MKESTIRDAIKEDLVVLAIINQRTIPAFRRMYGRDCDDLTVEELVDLIPSKDLQYLRCLIDSTLCDYQ